MGRNKDNTIRKLTRVGTSSYCVTIPMAIVRAFKWRERQKLQITTDEKTRTITIRDWSGNR